MATILVKTTWLPPVFAVALVLLNFILQTAAGGNVKTFYQIISSLSKLLQSPCGPECPNPLYPFSLISHHDQKHSATFSLVWLCLEHSSLRHLYGLLLIFQFSAPWRPGLPWSPYLKLLPVPYPPPSYPLHSFTLLARIYHNPKLTCSFYFCLPLTRAGTVSVLWTTAFLYLTWCSVNVCEWMSERDGAYVYSKILKWVLFRSEVGKWVITTGNYGATSSQELLKSDLLPLNILWWPLLPKP